MANNKKFYIDFNGKKVEYILEKGLTLSQKTSFVVEVAGTVVSSEVGYASILLKPVFDYYLVKYYTNIELFEDDSMFSLDMIDKFLKDNKENVINVIYESFKEECNDLQAACNDAIEYRNLHYNDLKDEIETLLQVVREFVVKPDRMNELLEALTNAANAFADRGDIDMDAVNKLVDIIPIMQKMGDKEVAKAIVKEFHDNKPTNKTGNKPKSSRGRKPKNTQNKVIAPNIEVVE